METLQGALWCIMFDFSFWLLHLICSGPSESLFSNTGSSKPGWRLILVGVIRVVRCQNQPISQLLFIRCYNMAFALSKRKPTHLFVHFAACFYILLLFDLIWFDVSKENRRKHNWGGEELQKNEVNIEEMFVMGKEPLLIRVLIGVLRHFRCTQVAETRSASDTTSCRRIYTHASTR